MTELPPGWERVPLQDLFAVIGDGSRHVKQRDYLPRGKVPVVDQGERLVGGFTNDEQLVHPGPLPMIVFGDHTRRFKFIDFPFAVGAQGTKLLAPASEMNPKFLYYQLLAKRLPDRGYGRHFALLRAEDLKVAPRQEQDRIVMSLEQHLSRLDAAVSGLATVRLKATSLLDTVLTTAFSAGSWGSRDEPVELRPLGEVVELLLDHRGQTPKKLGGDFVESGVRVVSAIHLKHGRIRFEERDRFVTHEMFERWMPERTRTGDVLLTSEAPLGSVAMVENDDPLVLSQRLFGLRAAEGILSGSYLRRFLESPVGQDQLRKRSSGTTVTGIRQSELRQVLIPIPTIAGQLQVVAALEDQFELVHTALAALPRPARVEALRHSIFEAAFSGQLAPQDPDDETASVLLGRIRADNAAVRPSKRTRKAKAS